MRCYDRLTQAVLRRPVELGLHPSIEMMVLSILDLIVIVLTWLEYRQLKRARHPA